MSNLDNDKNGRQPNGMDSFNTSSENDFPFATDESSLDPFAALSDSFSSQEGGLGDVSSFDEVSDISMGDSFSDSSSADFSAGLSTSDDDLGSSSAFSESGKKSGKKSKTRVKKEKSARDPLPKGPQDYAILALGIFFLFLIVVADLAALVVAGMSGLIYIVPVDILGLLLLSVPYLLWKKRRNGEVVNFYDAVLGISLSFIILACIILLTVQAKYYGTHVKAKASAIQIMDTRC